MVIVHTPVSGLQKDTHDTKQRHTIHAHSRCQSIHPLSLPLLLLCSAPALCLRRLEYVFFCPSQPGPTPAARHRQGTGLTHTRASHPTPGTEHATTRHDHHTTTIIHTLYNQPNPPTQSILDGHPRDQPDFLPLRAVHDLLPDDGVDVLLLGLSLIFCRCCRRRLAAGRLARPGVRGRWR